MLKTKALPTSVVKFRITNAFSYHALNIPRMTCVCYFLVDCVKSNCIEMGCPMGFGELNIPSSRAFWDDCDEDESPQNSTEK